MPLVAAQGDRRLHLGIEHKSGVKQIDRLLSNDGLNVDRLERTWLRYVVGGLSEVVVAMSWTNFDDDDHTTLCMYLVTRAGRALPLLWLTTKKSLLRDNQTRLETEMLERVVDFSPQGTHFTVLADRGFGKTELPPSGRPVKTSNSTSRSGQTRARSERCHCSIRASAGIARCP